MIHFRIRDYASTLVYRCLLRWSFGAFGRRARVVWPLRIVGSRFVRLEDDVTVQYGSYIAVLKLGERDPQLSVGAGTQIGNFSHIICTGKIEIGMNVLIADRVYIADNLHEYQDVGRPVMHQPLRQLRHVTVGAGSWIGENVCVVGCTIGRNCVIGSNSVVSRDIPDFCVAVGSPAVPVKRFCSDTGTWRKVDSEANFAD